MKKLFFSLLAVFMPVLFYGCHNIFAPNFFHELIPPEGDRIEAFSVSGQLYAEIGDAAIIVTVAPAAELRGIIPSVRVSEGATLFPVTWGYTVRAFGDERNFGAAMELYTGGNMTDKLIEMIKSNKSFVRPVLDLPIDFTYPVDFLVISGQGTVRKYTVRVEPDSGEGKFTAFRFDKFYNPELVRNTTAIDINTVTKTVEISVDYPVENIASYQLVPGFETNGARVYLDNGTELRSGASLLDFVKPPDASDLNNPLYGKQTKTLTLKRSGYDDTIWTLVVNFREDPDTSRAIVDFRFTRTRNPLISADYMADIIHSGNTGTIDVTVYYGGARPDELRPDFVSPGTVTVNGAMQTSGLSTQDFSAPLQYTVTSRVGNNIRTYTVKVNLIPASDPLPQISSFVLRTARNPQLLSDSTAMIDHNGGIIVIEAAYDGTVPPYTLVPEFGASGNVTINGAAQTSGTSAYNFSAPVWYTITNPSNPALKREYRVEVRFVRSLSSVAEITAFSFYKADNPGLAEDVHAVINQTTGEITATVLFETPGGSRTLVPRWSAQGRVQAGGMFQTSGASGRQFYTPQTYGAVSADSGFRKDYTVTIKEVNSRIYVRENAAGRNDGTNWQNAYRNLPEACADAALLPDSTAKELWIAEGTYRPSDRGNIDDFLPITPNTSYIGGFRGTEASAGARTNPAGHRPTITGDLGGGKRSVRIFLFGRPSLELPAVIYSFEDLILTHAGNGSANGSGICVENRSRGVVLLMKGLDFDDFISDWGGAVYLEADTITMQHCNFTNTQANGDGEYGGYGEYGGDGGALYSWASNVTLEHISVTGSRAQYSGAMFVNSGDLTIRNLELNDCRSENSCGGFYFVVLEMMTLADSVFTNCKANSLFRGADIGAVESRFGFEINITNCIFQDTTGHPYPPIGSVSKPQLHIAVDGGASIENCSFVNLAANSNTSFIIDIQVIYSGANPYLTVRNSTFTLNNQNTRPLSIAHGATLDRVSINDPYAAIPGIVSRNSGETRYSSTCTINGASGAAFGNYIQTLDAATKAMY